MLDFLLKRIAPGILSRPVMQPFNQLLFRITIAGMGIVEGFGDRVLKAARETLRKTDVMQFEFNEMNLSAQVTLEDLAALLPGFSIHRLLYDGSLLPRDDAPLYRRNIFVYQNLVAIRTPGGESTGDEVAS